MTDSAHNEFMNKLKIPRSKSARSHLPGNLLFWQTVLNQSDLFAYDTVNEGKGGPFGAQLWLVQSSHDRYILIGSAEEPEDSNAVVSKGRASAHAEAENLSPKKRAELIEFLEANRDQGWEVVQVSSGESCPSCRSKQILLANELIERGLVGKGGLFVVFKATYEQTQRDAGFHDAPYDQAFRAIKALGIFDSPEGLFGLDKALRQEPVTNEQVLAGELIFNTVDPVGTSELSTEIKAIFDQAKDQPVAVLVRTDGSVLCHAIDERCQQQDQINQPERSAIVGALHEAASKLRQDEGKFEAWNLEGAWLYTNIREIGPIGYSESLWYNLSGIKVVSDYTSPIVDERAQEMPGMNNSDLFLQVAAEYNSESSPLRVSYLGDPDEPSVAQMLWKAKMEMEARKGRQSDRLQELEQARPCTIQLIDGTSVPLSDLVMTSSQSSNYDGKQGSTPE